MRTRAGERYHRRKQTGIHSQDHLGKQGQEKVMMACDEHSDIGLELAATWVWGTD